MLPHSLERMFRATIAVLAGVLAAPLAHVAIDVVGDFALPHDTFDTVAHGSRGSVLALALALAVALAARIVWNALSEAQGGARVGRSGLERIAAEPLWRAVAHTFPIALCGVVAMEAVDLAAAGREADDLGDLLGGSIVLGVALIAAVVAVVVASVRAIAGVIAATHATIVAVLSLLLGETKRCTPHVALRRADDAHAPRTGARPMRCSGLRAPPLLHSN